VVFALSLLVAGANAKNAPSKLSQYKYTETPAEPFNAPEIGGSMFEAAAANTVTLGWWQFDTATGQPTKQGWVEDDVTVQIDYFHVDGAAGSPCTATITALSGAQSMWCGKEATTVSPYCGWLALPGYGNNWDQSLTSTVGASTLSYMISWESEENYDFTYVEWYDSTNQEWVRDPAVNGGAGAYDIIGGPISDASSAASAGLTGPTAVRFHFAADGAWSDEDGLNDTTTPGAVILDNLQLDAGAIEDWEGETCGVKVSSDGTWVAASPPGYGLYANLVSAATIVQEDPCLRPLSNMWEFFDNPLVTNYTCGGWPSQGAVPYGPNVDGLYMNNQVISPFFAISGAGAEYILSFLVYRDLPKDNLIFYHWGVRTKDNDPPANGCYTALRDDNFVYYGDNKDWIRSGFQVGTKVPATADEISVAVGNVDMCGVWCGIEGSGNCHSHGGILDQVKLQRVETFGPQWSVRQIDLWQDNFPELGDIAGVARCDMAIDILPGTSQNIVPGDSMKVTVTSPEGTGNAGFAIDATGGRSRRSVYVFVKCTDRFDNPRPYTGLQMQSPDNKHSVADVSGLLRFPLVTGGTVPQPAPNWEVYRMDYAITPTTGRVTDGFCADLMDGRVGGPDDYAHLYEPAQAGIFVPGDVIHYFLGAKTLSGQWSYLHRTLNGQGANRRTGVIAEAIASPMEWSVLPDAGRLEGDLGDILLVDDCDDRDGPAQLYFDFAFKYMGIEDRVDRYDVLGPSSGVGNSLASRVKSIQFQLIGDPTEIYQKILWNTGSLSVSLMGDGGAPNGGAGEKSEDFFLCDFFLDNHPDNPGWAYWGDDVVAEWALLGASPDPVMVNNKWINHTLTSDDQKLASGVVSPVVRVSTAPAPVAPNFVPTETFYAYGGCALINNFDVPGQLGNSRIAYRYNNAATGPVASLSQVTGNLQATNARFYLSGFAYNFIRDDDLNGVPDYVKHLQELLVWFENIIGDPVGIDPVAFNNLEDNYPNPFNPTTTIKYSIAERGHVSLKIYNAAGQLIRTLVNEEQAPQANGFSKVWNGLNDHSQPVASGVYFYQLTAKNFSQTKKMVLLK
jgi:hypothetical protein